MDGWTDGWWFHSSSRGVVRIVVFVVFVVVFVFIVFVVVGCIRDVPRVATHAYRT